MHRNSAEQFGLDHDNYMGSLVQSNRGHGTWTEFFIQERLVPQVAIAKNHGLINAILLDQFETLYTMLDQLCPQEKPALIHGDLWSGNYMIDRMQQPVLIDPAIAYSNREADLAMTTLFGGFQNSFYEAYNEAYPLQNDWQNRLDLWNLYPLLIHLNLFGLSYLSQIKQILKRYL